MTGRNGFQYALQGRRGSLVEGQVGVDGLAQLVDGGQLGAFKLRDAAVGSHKLLLGHLGPHLDRGWYCLAK
jgi:hypothetical protein